MIFRVAEVTFPYIFDVKMLIVANAFKDFHHHHAHLKLVFQMYFGHWYHDWIFRVDL